MKMDNRRNVVLEERPKRRYARRMALCRGRHPKWVDKYEKYVLEAASKVSSGLLGDELAGKFTQHAFDREMHLLRNIYRRIRAINRGQRAYCLRGTSRGLRSLCKHGVKERLRALMAAVSDSTASCVLNSAVFQNPGVDLHLTDVRSLYRVRAEKVGGRVRCWSCGVSVRGVHAVVERYHGLYGSPEPMCIANLNFSDFRRPCHERRSLASDVERVRGFAYGKGLDLGCVPSTSEKEDLPLPWKGL